jgi:hypothetical protein
MTHPNEQNLPLSTRFQPGSSGNRGGRPKTVDVRRRSIEAASLAVWERLVEQSLDGNLAAAALVLEHLRGVQAPHTARRTAETPPAATVVVP